MANLRKRVRVMESFFNARIDECSHFISGTGRKMLTEGTAMIVLFWNYPVSTLSTVGTHVRVIAYIGASVKKVPKKGGRNSCKAERKEPRCYNIYVKQDQLIQWKTVFVDPFLLQLIH